MHNVEDSKFALHNRKEIVSILEELAKHRVAINLDTTEGVKFVTSVLGVSSEGSHVYIDVSADDQINRQVTDSKHISFVTQTGVKVRWHSTHLRLVTLTDGVAFSMAIPSVVERIQRREYFRLSTPQGSKALLCKIPDGTAVIEAVVADMSVGGIGITVKGEPPAIFAENAILEKCSIAFPVVGVIPMSLRVCAIRPTVVTKNGEQMHHIGLEFFNLSRGAENVIQRYMIQLEAEKISLA